MRTTQMYAAYLDNFNEVNIYFSTLSYGGISKFFYIEDENHKQFELTILDVKLIETYYVYTCSIQGTLEFGKQYHVFHEHARKTPLIFSEVVKQPLFDQLFHYQGNDLGANYTKEETTFKVWAPTSYNVWLQLKDTMYQMKREDKGVYTYTIHENILHEPYLYYVEVNGIVNKTQDPYAKACTTNSKKSVVHESKKTLNEIRLKKQNSYTDAIIYELSVRDYSSKNTFNSLIEEKIVEYVKELGATHIQLLPITDFGSVDDLDIKKYYNWGYDQISWMTLENSYSSDVEDPIQIIRDVKEFIRKSHQLGIRVNLDVVFNHLYDLDASPLHCCVPYYYFQYNKEQGYSNASGCGNDIDSLRTMSSKLIIDSCMYLIKEFDIDGLRFDLMGILDIRTMNELTKACQNIKSDFMIYGEGWNMPSYLPEDRRATIVNQDYMPNIAHFSDRFRDILKGNEMQVEPKDLGYLLGDTSKIFKAMNVFGASTQCVGNYPMFDSPIKALNYIECHDNQTSWDRIDEVMDISLEDKKKYHKLLLGACILAQGIPFIHGGQEFARTKLGLNNTYNTSDVINHIDWKRLDKNNDIYKYVKCMISIRKKINGFRINNIYQLHSSVTYETIYDIALVYKIEDDKDDVKVIFNPTNTMLEIEVESKYQLLYHDENKGIENGKLVLPKIGLVILYKYK